MSILSFLFSEQIPTLISEHRARMTQRLALTLIYSDTVIVGITNLYNSVDVFINERISAVEIT